MVAVEWRRACLLSVYYFISPFYLAFPKCLFVGGMGDVGVQGRSQPWLGEGA